MRRSECNLYRQHTAITLKNESGTFTARVEDTEFPITRLVDELIVPVLLAAGYSPKAIGKLIDSEMV